ncbi:MAG: 3-deoxy-D-manno-octulosonic acid transferase [Pedosphaera sp.]|nr:3-deoxy-D-manno-octulosonic acid transferase [Pedosphaera sp.]
MRTLYNILLCIGFVLTAPFYLLKMWRRGDWLEGFSQRFGKYESRLKQRLTNRHTLWFHAVSVGEVNLCTQLIQALEPRVPNLKLIVSTTTSTAMGELKKKLPSHIERIYYPIDRRKYINRAMAVINPEAVILVEAELWPNFLWGLQSRGIPHFLVNARLSPQSFRGYRRCGFLFRPLFERFTGIGAQTEADAGRLKELGFNPAAIHVVGSLKFDAARLVERGVVDVVGLLRQVGVQDDALIVVGGSTHAGEEVILLEVVRRLRPRFPGLLLVLVPRHMERGGEVGRELQARKAAYVYRSEINPLMRRERNDLECMIVNTTGELRFFYERADVVFVGKSLSAEGGQNPIEPAALGKPVLFGPNMQNFLQIASEFVRCDGAIQIRDAAELERAVGDLLANPARRTELGRNAIKVVKANQGSLEKTVDMILAHLSEHT